MKLCSMKSCIFYYVTILANIAALIGFVILMLNTYGQDKYIALLLCVPPLLSLIALYKGGDREERRLKKRIRKAALRKELDDLKKYDTDTNAKP